MFLRFSRVLSDRDLAGRQHLEVIGVATARVVTWETASMGSFAAEVSPGDYPSRGLLIAKLGA